MIFILLVLSTYHQDWVKARELFTQSAQRGDLTATYNVGFAWRYGQGGPPDMTLAAAYFSQAAAHGHMNASLELGKMYADGMGEALPQDCRRAALLFARTASFGSWNQINHWATETYLDKSQAKSSRLKSKSWSKDVEVIRIRTALLLFLRASDLGYPSARMNAAYLLRAHPDIGDHLFPPSSASLERKGGGWAGEEWRGVTGARMGDGKGEDMSGGQEAVRGMLLREAARGGAVGGALELSTFHARGFLPGRTPPPVRFLPWPMDASWVSSLFTSKSSPTTTTTRTTTPSTGTSTSTSSTSTRARVPSGLHRAVRLWRQLPEEAEALYYLGLMHATGSGGRALDLRLADEFWTQAVTRDHGTWLATSLGRVALGLSRWGLALERIVGGASGPESAAPTGGETTTKYGTSTDQNRDGDGDGAGVMPLSPLRFLRLSSPRRWLTEGPRGAIRWLSEFVLELHGHILAWQLAMVGAELDPEVRKGLGARLEWRLLWGDDDVERDASGATGTTRAGMTITTTTTPWSIFAAPPPLWASIREVGVQVREAVGRIRARAVESARMMRTTGAWLGRVGGRVWGGFGGGEGMGGVEGQPQQQQNPALVMPTTIPIPQAVVPWVRWLRYVMVDHPGKGGGAMTMRDTVVAVQMMILVLGVLVYLRQRWRRNRVRGAGR